jgi:uncharacterized membrane protein YoaT (DUF817 family)
LSSRASSAEDLIVAALQMVKMRAIIAKDFILVICIICKFVLIMFKLE